MKELLHFTADWCKPCQAMKPIIESFINDNPDVKYTKIDIEEDFETTKSYNILGIPTLIAMEDGIVSGRHTGSADYQKIESLLKNDSE